MKILAIGDIHGRKIWKNIQFDHYDQVIFLGDYLDSHRLSNDDILGNLEELIKLQESQQNISFLIGNHDLQYTDPEFVGLVSGYRESCFMEAYELLHLLKWKFAIELDNVLYTHAGLLKAFYESIPPTSNQISETINSAGFSNPYYFLTTLHPLRGGASRASSSIWCDFREILAEENPIPINQVFGHSAREGGQMDRKAEYWRICIDVLTKYKNAYEIVDGEEPKVVSLQE
ncbi:metallophosphoesterase [Leptospira paudalimensis]|uniref:Metallophosphoesterase n=1 Tax=Leptospira paudalimensis TaxID=2950024 RepID=A0ABT3MDK3_9LEPT|nr:metallophosphoesterase [Leptospira paudalimensis]MCW7506131.1 metallophosphoesterase [Leptospira paudalimensis]